MRIEVYGKSQEAPAEFAEYLNPAHTAILSIDMHRGHLDDSPDCPCPAPRAREIVAPINAFHQAARARGIRVIHITTELRADGTDEGISAAWRSTFPLHVGPIPNSGAHALAGSRWTDLMTEAPAADLRVTSKKRLSVFYPTDLDFLLRNLGVKVVVLNGGFTDCCVLNAAFDASNRLYRVIVLRDLVRGTDEYLEDAALAMVSLHTGLVTNAADLLAAWG